MKSRFTAGGLVTRCIMMGCIVMGCFVSRARAADCGFQTISGMNFGSYDVFGPAVESVGNIRYLCVSVQPQDRVLIEISRGNSATFFSRYLLSGVNRLNYNLYLDPTRTTVWGDGTSGTSVYGPVAPADSLVTTVNVYGSIPANQDVRVGSYGDTLVVTMTF